MKLFTIYFALLSSTSFAKVIDLVKITNDYDSEIAYFKLDENDKTHEIEFFIKETYQKGVMVNKETFTIQDAYIGTTLYTLKGREVINLKSDNLNSHNGGQLTIDYLFNGVTGSRNNIEIELERAGSSWDLTKDHNKLSELKFIANSKPFVGAIGIRTVKFIF